MPRHPEYNADEALDRALHLFWRQGYLDTSIEDLVEATGVQRYGLYQSFGSKRDLFLAALARYRDDYLTERMRDLDSPEAGLQAIRSFLEGLAAAAGSPAGRHGCLFCNTAVELGSRDSEADSYVGRYVESLRSGFRRCLERAKARGELPAEEALRPLADYLAGVVIGACVYARTPAPRQAVRALLETAIERLPAVRP